jgi:O-antigen/teichoic acid export membrane protein
MAGPLFIGKFFAPGLFGSYSLSKLILFFFCAVLVSSTQTPFIVLASQEKKQTGKICKTFTIQSILLFIGIIIFVSAIIFCGNFLASFAQISVGSLWALAFAFFGFAMRNFVGSMLLAIDEKTRNAQMELIFGVVYLLGIFILYFSGKLNISTSFFLYFIAGAATTAFFLTVNTKLFYPFSFNKTEFAETIKFTLWMIFGATSVYFINWGDNFVLKFFVSIDDIGVYNLAYQFFKGISLLALIIRPYFLPFVSQNISNRQKMSEYLYQKRFKLLFLTFAGVVIIFMLAPLLEKFYGHSYGQAIPVLRILLVATIVVSYSTFYDTIFFALKKYKFQQIVNFIQILLNLILDFILIPRFGIKGAGIATLLAYFSSAVIYEIYFSIKLKAALV